MELQVGDSVLCTVEKIDKVVVSVKIEGDGWGSIVASEIAPGRIRNIRDYVVPKKKIVCKVLRVSRDHADLSLRRVTQKERKEVMDKHNQERSYASILKSILGDKAEKIISNILQNSTLYDLIEESKTDSKKLEAFLEKSDAEKVLTIVNSQKIKKIEVKKEFNLKTHNPEGITQIKKVLADITEAEIKYLAAGRYIIKKESDDPKKAENKIKEILEKIAANAKKEGMEFSIKEK